MCSSLQIFFAVPHCYTTFCYISQRSDHFTFDIMPSDIAQFDRLYYEVPGALAPFASSMVPLMRFYNRQRLQYCQLLNLIDETMEQTSSLLNKLQGATSFTKFGELPPELRVKIWQFAMPEARTVIIRSPHTQQTHTPTSLDDVLSQTLGDERTWQSTTQIPALLHVNAEARYEALKHYSLSLGVGKAQPRVYIDFNRDTLFFGDTELKPECSELWAETKDLNRVQRLAVVPEGAWRALRWMKVELDNSLQKLIFVHGSEKIKLGQLPHLVEDEQSETDTSFQGFEQHVERSEPPKPGESPDPETSKKERIEAARDECSTLKMVLSAAWKEPAISTAVFRKSRGDRWVC
ncbi:hypothetical protein F4777DRAFT_97615 [Nemania sp. FL0916]|nr:hypothetical protein F4777DRAFT_97615 [Nemania sp. FL0916]